MLRRIGTVVLLLLVPAAGRAADPPERLLPAGTQIYLRWDGVEAHRAAYEKTALGKTLQGDTGKFFTGQVELLGVRPDGTAVEMPFECVTRVARGLRPD